jgi:hypothetical protein
MTNEPVGAGLARAREKYAEAVQQRVFGRHAEAVRLWEEAYEL